MSITLWHIPLSHYNEKARFALDYKGVPYRTRAPLPGSHQVVSMALTRGRHRRFPVLSIDGTNVGDSTAIIAELERRFPEPPLYPADPAERARALELEDYFDEHLAPAIRIFGFSHILETPSGLADALFPTATGMKRRIIGAATPAARPVMKRDYGVAVENRERARADILAAMDRLESELGGGEYLVGGRFSVADLTAASLFTPIVGPPGRPYLPRDTSPPLLQFRRELEARPGGRWIHEMYRRHRGARSAA